MESAGLEDFSLLCNKCGTCCKALVLLYSREEILASVNRGSNDGKFIIENMVEISYSEALSINPRLELWNKLITDSGKTPYFYKCTALIDNECSKYDSRPKMCSDYPFYDQDKINPTMLFYTKGCAYNKDEYKIPVSAWPEEERERILSRIEEVNQ